MFRKPILVVDDEPSMRMALFETLSRSGHAVTLAQSGLEAIARFKEDNFHLVITDVKMPHMDGIEVLREIKKQNSETPVVMITGYGTVENAVEAMKEGAFDYILKPFSVEVLEEIVHKALNGNLEDGKVEPECTTHKIITADEKMLKLLELARHVARSKATVLIQGESGTGKELLARYIHTHSPRRDKPFVAVNCAALPEGLLESELFGHEKGSFTGAISRRLGKFELANHGTLLLDEISEMNFSLQAKLLRVLQESEIDRIGGKLPVSIDARIITTTNRDLEEMVNNGQFREDVFFRLNVIPLRVPPLRERPDDIEPLANHFLEKYGSGSTQYGRKNNKKGVMRISEKALQLLKQRTWKGNVRELENIIERGVLLVQGNILTPSDLSLDGCPNAYGGKARGPESCPIEPVSQGGPVSSLKDMEKELIVRALRKTRGNRTHAARILGISVRTLRNKLHEYSDLML
jgi:DNA-binding NtrC family response regulator